MAIKLFKFDKVLDLGLNKNKHPYILYGDFGIDIGEHNSTHTTINIYNDENPLLGDSTIFTYQYNDGENYPDESLVLTDAQKEMINKMIDEHFDDSIDRVA